MIRSVGIIGLGSFGTFAASLLPKDLKVIGHDSRRSTSDMQQGDLRQVMETDAVIIAIPLSAYEATLRKIKPLLAPETLIIDVCSVKVRPNQLIEKHLPGHPNLLITHPLFGPESAAAGRTKGHDLIVTKSSGEKANQALDFCQNVLELRIHRMTPEEHDRAMARVHALTFFVARGLATTDVGKAPFKTPSFQMILDLIDLDSKHSDELFRTIEQGNPYAEKVRQQLLKNFENVAIDLRSTA